MADTTTLAKAFIKPEVGSHPDTWGYVLNDNLDLIDRAVGGALAITIGGDYALSEAQAQNLSYEISGALSADAVITFPAFRGMAFVRNLTSGGFRLICQMVTNGAAIAVLPAVDRLLVGDGVDFFSNVAAVAKSGDTMTGPLVILTPGTGLAVSEDGVFGHNLQVGNGVFSPGYYSYGNPILVGNAGNAGFTVVYDNSAASSLYLGNINDQTNYYRQTNHRLQARGGGQDYAFFNAGGNSLWGTLTINNASTPGTLTVLGGGNAVYVPNGGGVFGGDVYASNVRLAGTSVYFSGGGGGVNTTGGPLIYGDAQNNVWKLGNGNGSFLFQDYAGGNVVNISASGGIYCHGLDTQGGGLTSGAVYTGSISSGPISGSSINGSGIIASSAQVANAIYASAGGIYTEGNLYCKSSGVVFLNIDGNHGFNFRWDGARAYVRIDNAVEYPIANADTFGAYLPTGGGTISGGLNVNGYLNAFGGLGVNGQATFNSYAVANGGFGVNGGSQLNGGVHVTNGLFIDNGGIAANGDAGFNNSVNVNDRITAFGGSGGQSGGWAIYAPNAGILTNGVVQASASGTAFYAPNGNVVYQNSQAANDACSGGVFRRYILGTGPKGALVECWGGDWDSMAFCMGGGDLLVSPDRGTSGYVIVPSGSFSDARLKTGIRDTKVDALALICATRVREFEWNEEGRRLMPYADRTVECGLVAQELEETIPIAVATVPIADDARYISDRHLTPYFMRAFQQLVERVEALEAG